MTLLSLEGADEGLDLYQQNYYWDTVDALPYIDPLTGDAAVEVNRLIQEELVVMGVVQLAEAASEAAAASSSFSSSSMTTSTLSSSLMNPSLKDYLADFPLVPTPRIDHLLEAYEEKWRGHASGGGSTTSSMVVDMRRYADLVPPSASLTGSISEWREAVNRGQTLLEYSSNGLQNLELMKSHCQRAWLKHLADAEVHQTNLKGKVTKIKEQIDRTNKKRKLDQISCANEMRNLLRSHEEYVERNSRISMAIAEIHKR